MKTIILIALVAMALTPCTKENNVRPQMEGPGKPGQELATAD